MQDFKEFTISTKPIFFLALFVLAITGCKKETVLFNEIIVDNYVYDVGGQAVYQTNLEKTKQKSNLQYISVLYQNVFRQAILGGKLGDLNKVRTAIGDKSLADELVANAFINDNQSQIPTDAEMRSDVDQFVIDTYLRFYLRFPNAYEKFYLKQEIVNDTDLSPELIFTAFASSNEYKFY